MIWNHWGTFSLILRLERIWEWPIGPYKKRCIKNEECQVLLIEKRGVVEFSLELSLNDWKPRFIFNFQCSMHVKSIPNCRIMSTLWITRIKKVWIGTILNFKSRSSLLLMQIDEFNCETQGPLKKWTEQSMKLYFWKYVARTLPRECMRVDGISGPYHCIVSFKTSELHISLIIIYFWVPILLFRQFQLFVHILRVPWSMYGRVFWPI